MKKIYLVVAIAVLTICGMVIDAQALTRWWGNKGWTTSVMSDEEVISILKQSMVYFRHKDRCYAAIPFVGAYGTKQVSITQINCTDDIR